MDGILKVTPEKLRSTASDFGSKATGIKTTTDIDDGYRERHEFSMAGRCSQGI